MLNISYSGQFKKDVERAKKQGKDMKKLKHIIELLVEQKSLPIKLQDHPLKGNWKGYRDLHIEPDWLLIYKFGISNIRFERTGTHSEIF